ncbi:hypothetical protein DY000_02055491 [Brassica cretica]|uniref:Uncharacterized protein n=1 Tax=Brassica cretica TaxID=69181 RepID=A0ABQ7A5L5_BRACR|nr:hypothetical protein DY000_02055491 [Brassica cretica]
MGVRNWWRRGFFVCFRHFQNVRKAFTDRKVASFDNCRLHRQLRFYMSLLPVLQFVSMENLNSRVEFTGFSVFLSLRNLDVCAVSVAILPQADEVDVQLRNEDLMIDWWLRWSTCQHNQQRSPNNQSIIQLGSWSPSKTKDHNIWLRLQSSRSKLRSEQWRPIWTNPYVQFSIEDMMEGENLDTFIDALLLRQEMDAIPSFSSTS